MVDRILLGNDESGNKGFWVSKPSVNVLAIVGNTYLETIGNWYGYQEEFDGDRTDGSFTTGIEPFSGFRGTTEVKTTATGTLIYTGGEGDIALRTKQNFTGSGATAKPTAEAFVGSDYPIIEMRIRMLYDPILEIPPTPNSYGLQVFFVNADTNGLNTLVEHETRTKLIYGGNYNNVFDEVGVWKTLEWDMSDVEGWMDPYAHNGSTGSYSSAFRISMIRFDLTNGSAAGAWTPTTNPMWEIDYVRVKHKDIPKNAGRDGTINSSLIFDSDINHMGLVHQTGTVTIGTAKAYIDGTTSDRVAGHNIDNDANGYVAFPELPYIPLILFQRLDENHETTGTTFLLGEDEYSICETKWEDNRYPTIDMNTSEPSWKGYDLKMVNYGERDLNGKLLNDPSTRISSLAYYNNITGNPVNVKENFYVSTSHPPSGEPTNPAAAAGANWNAPFNTGTGQEYWHTYYTSYGTDFPREEVEDWRGFGGIWNARKSYREESFTRSSEFYLHDFTTIAYNAQYSLDDPGQKISGYGQTSDTISRGRPILPDFVKGIPPFSERSKITNTTGDVISGYRKWDDLKTTFYETRTFAYARAKKDGFWLTCRNAIAQEGMEPVLNLAPIFPEESKDIAVQGHLAYTTMVCNTDNGAWGMFHPGLALYDGEKFTEGLQLKWDSKVTANSFLLDKVGMDDVGNEYPQYKWWPSFSCSGLTFNGDLAYPTANVNSLSEIKSAQLTWRGYHPGWREPSPGHFKMSYEKVAGKYDAQYTANGILGDVVDLTSGFYPYRTQSNLVYHEHLNAGEIPTPWPSVGSIDLQTVGSSGQTRGNINKNPPESPNYRYADADSNYSYSTTPGHGLGWGAKESGVVDGARVVTQYNYKRISSPGIRHPDGIIPLEHYSRDNRNSYKWGTLFGDPLIDGTDIYNQTAYIGGAVNTKDGPTIASYDSTKVRAPKYKYWVLRVPVSIPEYS